MPARDSNPCQQDSKQGVLPTSPRKRVLRTAYLNEVFKTKRYIKKFDVCKETNPLPKLWIRISDSESESIIPNPRNQSESDSADSSRIGFGNSFLLVGIGSIFPFEDPDP
ncbi:hypothetical protein AVEN_125343-1 [Araneus ventricosus]|uniref:Uncharacterized protein n=1 Tax=Araneus ventricosus TaxID=182803 RepID=A0A4Y2IE53_ARAVE|nr:hypothetical protein AVEN_125343-1 [Araneus ventricosus]